MSIDLEQPAGNAGSENGGTDPVGSNGASAGTVNGNEQPAKRGRGRPRTKPVDPVIDPASFGTGTGGSGGTGDGGSTDAGNAKRARPRKEKTAPLSVEALIVGLGMAQLAAMTATGLPECDIGEAQTKKLAQALSNVSRHYPPIQLTEKQQDWFMLAYVGGQIVFGQFLLFSARMMKEKQAEEQRKNSNVVDGIFTRTQ